MRLKGSPTGLLVATSIFAACASCAPDIIARGAAHELLEGAACLTEVASQARTWGAGDVFLTAPPSTSGDRTYRLPTGMLGTWVVLSRPSVGPLTITRVNSSGTTTLAFRADCSAVETFVVHASPAGDRSTRFTDDDLRDALLRHQAGGLVVYAWSPHMPLSVEGFREVAEAARRLGMTAVPVLIAHSEADFARREAERAAIPLSGLREMDSVELIQRGVQLHAPSIIAFGYGRVSALLPGYRNADGYGRFLEAFANEAQ